MNIEACIRCIGPGTDWRFTNTSFCLHRYPPTCYNQVLSAGFLVARMIKLVVATSFSIGRIDKDILSPEASSLGTLNAFSTYANCPSHKSIRTDMCIIRSSQVPWNLTPFLPSICVKSWVMKRIVILILKFWERYTCWRCDTGRVLAITAGVVGVWFSYTL